MKTILIGIPLLALAGISLYFFFINADISVSVRFTEEVKTPPLPLGMVLIFAFFSGFVGGIMLCPLTYVIKRLS